jgi:hypothetical protein
MMLATENNLKHGERFRAILGRNASNRIRVEISQIFGEGFGVLG